MLKQSVQHDMLTPLDISSREIFDVYGAPVLQCK